MGEVNKALGGGSYITVGEKTYIIAPCDYEIQAMYECWLEGRAWKSLERAKVHLSEQEFQSQRSQTSQDIAAGVYTFGSEPCAKSLRTIPGLKQLLLLQLKSGNPKDPEVDATFVDKIFEKQMEEALAKMNELSHDPNSPAPAADAA